MSKIKSVVKLLRVKQWIKNVFVFAAIIFAGKFTQIDLLMTNLAVFFLFSLVASTVYIINDIIDVEEDKKSPKKRLRPLASGALSIKTAKIMAFFLLLISLFLAYLVNIKVLLVLSIYFVMNVLYCIKLKEIVIIDVMTISMGFILRVLAGAVALNISLSPWLILCTGLITLYLGFGKRKNEIVLLGEQAGEHRKTLSLYSTQYLDKILLLTMSLTWMTYLLYIIQGSSYPYMVLTFPFVVYGTLRYEYLIMEQQKGDSPEDVFTEDIPFLINIVLWAIASFIVVYLLK